MIFHGIEIDESRLARNYFEQPLKKGSYPSEEEIRYLYLECNLTSAELDEFMHKQMQKKLTALGIKKPISKRVERIKSTNLERYGCTSSVHAKEIWDQVLKNHEKKYGTKYPSQTKEVKDKIKNTCLKKYGTVSACSSEEIKNQIKQTNIKKYGCENPFGNKEIQNKIRQTCIDKYGTERACQAQEIKDRIRQSNMDKYGVPSASCLLSRHYEKKLAEILGSKEKLEQVIEEHPTKAPYDVAKELGTNIGVLRKYAQKYDLWRKFNHGQTKAECELHEKFPNIFVKTRSVIHPYEIDLYSDKYSLGIEYNGNWWHSEQKGISKDYHQKKSLLAEEKGIFIYHLFEYEWLDPRKQEIILSQINNLLGRNERKIYARQCKIKEVSSKEARVFLEENHLQGQDISKIRYGLYFGEELVSLMTFVKPRFDKKYQWELSRFCNKKGTSVIGGASKLFKHFIKEYEPKSILSYSQIAKTRGTLYEKLRFKLDHISKVGYVWCREDQVLSRYQCQKHKLLKQGFEGSSEAEIMENQGFYQIFDCGNKVWVWQKESY